MNRPPFSPKLLNSEIRKFLVTSGIKLRIAGGRQWTTPIIIRLMMIVLRSETDVLSGWYPSLDAFEAYINRLNIADELVPSRGRVMSDEAWDTMVARYQECQRPCPYQMTTVRGSKHLFQFTTFMEAFGLDSYEGYLETRSWFGLSAELQRMILEVVLQGNGHLIEVAAGDFREHITSLLIRV